MILSEELRNIVNQNTKKTKESLQSKKKSMQRSDDDWPEVKKFIRSILLEEAKETRYNTLYKLYKRKYLVLYFSYYTPYKDICKNVKLSDGNFFFLNLYDIARFCEEESLNLKLGISKELCFNLDDLKIINYDEEIITDNEVSEFGFKILSDNYYNYRLLACLVEV